jgi:hypothetical protein
MQRRLSLVNSQADPPGTVSPERSDERMQRRHITRIFALSPGSPGFVSAPSTRLHEYASPPTPKNVRICMMRARCAVRDPVRGAVRG